MSIFRATVPAGVLLYHGRGDQEVVKGMEWLAFEAEHAMMFAKGMPHPRGGKGGHSGPGPGRDREETEIDPEMQEDINGRKWGYDSHNGQRVINEANEKGLGVFSTVEHPELRRRGGDKHKPMDNDRGQVEDHTGGYLHHYRTLHDLNLLYLDGQSAGKTSKGTLDTQDYLLLGKRPGESDSPFDDVNRAVGLCNLTRTIWEGNIDGFVRMECGFEILLCQFEGNVELDRWQMVRNDWKNRRNMTEEMRNVIVESNFRLYKAVSDRFWGIGENRVEVDFGELVTAFSRGQLDLFERSAKTGEMLPRLRNGSADVLESLRHEITEMVQMSPRRKTADWQKVSDMYVQGYAGPLQAFLLPDLEMEDFRRQLELLLWVFASEEFGMRSVGDVVRRDEVVERCINQFLPRTWNESLAGRAVQSVSSRLCGTLANTLFDITTVDVDQENDGFDRYTMARREIEGLVSWLDWPIWRYCSPDCAVNEVCVLPIWPVSDNIEDRKKPNCKNATTLAKQAVRGFNDSYWYTPDNRTEPPPGGPHRGKPPKGYRQPRFLE